MVEIGDRSKMREITDFLEARWRHQSVLEWGGSQRAIHHSLPQSISVLRLSHCHIVAATFNNVVAWNARWNAIWIYLTCVCGDEGEGYREEEEENTRKIFA